MADPLDLTATAESLRQYALGFPETVEDHPWGESAFKVRGKVFLFMTELEEQLNLSVKLPESREMAYTLPFAEPTGYGLGKHGWVTAQVRRETDLLYEMLTDWVDESFRAIAPKKLVAQLDGPKP